MMGSGMKFDSWLRKILLSSPLMAMKLQLFEQTALYKSRLEKSIILEVKKYQNKYEPKLLLSFNLYNRWNGFQDVICLCGSYYGLKA